MLVLLFRSSLKNCPWRMLIKNSVKMFAFLVLSRPIISKVSLSMLTQYVSSALRLRVPQTIGQPTTRLCCFAACSLTQCIEVVAGLGSFLKSSLGVWLFIIGPFYRRPPSMKYYHLSQPDPLYASKQH